MFGLLLFVAIALPTCLFLINFQFYQHQDGLERELKLEMTLERTLAAHIVKLEALHERLDASERALTQQSQRLNACKSSSTMSQSELSKVQRDLLTQEEELETYNANFELLETALDSDAAKVENTIKLLKRSVRRNPSPRETRLITLLLLIHERQVELESSKAKNTAPAPEERAAD